MRKRAQKTGQETENLKLFLKTGKRIKKTGIRIKIREIPQQIRFEGFPKNFEKTGDASKKILFGEVFVFFCVRFRAEAFP